MHPTFLRRWTEHGLTYTTRVIDSDRLRAARTHEVPARSAPGSWCRLACLVLGTCAWSACVDPSCATPTDVTESSREGSVARSDRPTYEARPIELPPGIGVAIPFEYVDTGELDHFYRALDRARLGTDQARVAIWGGSHTACDHWTGTMRDSLQRALGDAGHGFTLPAWPSDRWPYWRWGARVDTGSGWERLRLGWHRGVPDDYGVAGLVFDSMGRRATAEVRTSTWGVGQRASAIEVWTQEQPGGGPLAVHIDGELVADLNTDGNTVRARFDRFQLRDGPHVVRLETHGPRPVRLYGLVLERDGPGVVVDNFAISGARARNHQKWLDRTFVVQLARRRPDLVVFAYGGNEANDEGRPIDLYVEATRQALGRIRDVVPDVSCLFVGPTDKPKSRDGDWIDRPRLSAVIDAQREIAQSQGCAFFDARAFMGGPLSMLRWVSANPPLARGDHVHLSARGYRALGQLITNNLLEGWRPARSNDLVD